MAGPPDPQVLAALLAMRDGAEDPPPPAVGDVSARRSAALYLHGGGMILDWERVGGLYDAEVRGYVAASGPSC